jgi:hypothetical protein
MDATFYLPIDPQATSKVDAPLDYGASTYQAINSALRLAFTFLSKHADPPAIEPIP